MSGKNETSVKKGQEEEKTELKNEKVKISKRFSLLSVIAPALVGVIAFASWKYLKNYGSEFDTSKLSYWSFDSTNGHESFKKVFDHLDYKEVNGSQGEAWDVLWSNEPLFDQFPNLFKDLEPHQLVNHFPSIAYLTHKMHLAITTESKYIPQAFDFPRLKNEFLYFHKTYQDKKFVVKNFDSRGVKIVNFEEIDFLAEQTKYIQEFISNPLLIDGHAFDLGVFVLITSMNPLRIYMSKADVLLRFCPEPYHPFDAQSTGKYVVDAERYLPHWEMPSFMDAAKQNYSALDTFNQYLTKNELDDEKLWTQVDDAIISLTLSKTSQIYRYVDKFRKDNPRLKSGLFELLRFDFIVDETLDLHLMEINTVHHSVPENDRDERLSVMYEQLVYNTLAMLGATNYHDVKSKTFEESQLLSATKDIVVSPDICLRCLNTCEDDCDICLPCLSSSTVSNFHQAYREHQRRGEMTRIFPTETYAKENFMNQFSMADKLSVKWFKGKCESDIDWC